MGLREDIIEEFETTYDTVVTKAKASSKPTKVYLRIGGKNLELSKELSSCWNSEELTLKGTDTQEYIGSYHELHSNSSEVIVKLLEDNLEKASFIIEEQGYTPTKKSAAFPKKLIKLIDKYKDAKDVAIENIIVLEVDENGRTTSLDDWKKAYEAALSGERGMYERRAVYVDDVLCIHASAAIEHLDCFEEYRSKAKERDPRKDCNLIYKACETTGGMFKDVYCRYAEPEEIEVEIARLENK